MESKGKNYFLINFKRGGQDYPDIIRFSEMHPDYDIIKDGVMITDVHQGGLGDCYLMSAIAALAEYEDRIKRILLQRTRSPVHAYCVALCLGGEFQEIVLDDRFYGTKYSWGPIGVAFSHSNDEELWACLLEKAYAKAYGAFYNIVSGSGDDAFYDLTGAPSESIMVTQTFHWSNGKTEVKTMSKEEKKALFKRLLKYDQNKFAMTCATKGSGEKKMKNGLCGGHA